MGLIIVKKFCIIKKVLYLCSPIAEIAQLVERNLAKVEVAGPSPVFRSKITTTGKVVVFFVSGRGPGGEIAKTGVRIATKK